jgi:hypothetical protein
MRCDLIDAPYTPVEPVKLARSESIAGESGAACFDPEPWQGYHGARMI